METTKRPGRKRDDAWKEVDVDDDGYVYCLRCESVIHKLGYTHVDRVKRHLRETCAKRPRQEVVTSYFPPQIDAAMQDQFNKLFALWLFTTGMAFYKAQHKTCAAVFRLLNPTVTIPSQYLIRGRLLDECYDDSICQMRAALARRFCSLVTDGWTDINGFAVINYLAICGQQTFFLESVYTGSTSHDAVFLADDIQRVIRKYDFIDFVAVVTDNTPANQNAWAILQEPHPKMFFHGCASHTVNLLVKDVVASLKWLEKLVADCKDVVVFFKKNHKLWYHLKNLQQEDATPDGGVPPALALPCDTRWGSILACLQSVLKSEKILLQLVSDRGFLSAPTKAKKAARRAVFDVVTGKALVPQLQKAVKVLEPLVKYQRRFEKNRAVASEVFDMFLVLPSEIAQPPLTAAEQAAVRSKISARFDFVYGDAHGVAHLLDPRFAGVGMDVNTKDKVETFVTSWHGSEKAEDVMVELSQFQGLVAAMKGSHKLGLLKKKKIAVTDFWSGLSSFPLLQAVAEVAFNVVCSSAAAERNFSTHKFVHSTLRNRLAPERVEKLVHIFFNAKNCSTDELEFLDEFVPVEDDDDAADSNEDDDFIYY